MTFLFWNLGNKDLRTRLARIVSARSVDVVVLAECAQSASDVAASLSSANADFNAPFGGVARMRMIVRSSVGPVHPVFRDSAGGRFDIWRIEGDPAILLATAHLIDAGNYDVNERSMEAIDIARTIVRIETDEGHRRTVLVGDLNMNPFDAGVAGSKALHGVMTKDLATGRGGSGERTVLGTARPMFYNPMWGFFGDRTPGPPGTFYYTSGPNTPFWHMVDQVLVRPELMDGLRSVEVLDSDGTESLLDKHGRPDRTTGSDHLPLLFELDT